MFLTYGRYVVVNEKEPAWSPDGRYIAFACIPLNTLDRPPVDILDDLTYYERINGICIKNMATGKISWVARTLGMRHPAWSLDGNYLAWEAGNTILIWNMATKEYCFSPYTDCLQLFPEADRKVIIRDDRLLPDLPVKALDSAGEETNYVISPSRSHFVYIESWDDDLSQELVHSHLTVKEAETGATTFESYISDDWYEWSADGSILAWVAIPQRGNVLLGLTNIETGETSFLPINDLGRPGGNSWSPTDDKIALKNDAELNVVKIICEDDPFECRIMSQQNFKLRGHRSDWFTWSPDGKQVAYQTSYDYGHIWIIDLDTGQEYPLIERGK